MEFFDVLSQRHSIRAYHPTPVEPEKLEQILQAINRAPSAGNRQAFEVYLVQDAPRQAKLVEAAHGQEFLAQAPLVLVFCAHPALSQVRYGVRGETLYTIQDATIACTCAMLAATALGLSSVWVGAFDEEQRARRHRRTRRPAPDRHAAYRLRRRRAPPARPPPSRRPYPPVEAFHVPTFHVPTF